MRGLMTSLKKTLGCEEDLVLLGPLSTSNRTKPSSTRRQTSSASGGGPSPQPPDQNRRSERFTSRNATKKLRKDGQNWQP